MRLFLKYFLKYKYLLYIIRKGRMKSETFVRIKLLFINNDVQKRYQYFDNICYHISQEKIDSIMIVLIM